MRRTPPRVHPAFHEQGFALRYWGAVGAAAALLLAGTAAAGQAAGESLVGATFWTLLLVVGVVVPLVVRWQRHRYAVSERGITELSHPYLFFTRRRVAGEIRSVEPCPPAERTWMHGPATLVVRCDDPRRDLPVTPANTEQFLDHVAETHPALGRYRDAVRSTAGPGRTSAAGPTPDEGA